MTIRSQRCCSAPRACEAATSNAASRCCAMRRAQLSANDLALRSESALGIALARYNAGDLAAAERELEAVDPDSAVVFARALELRGWIAKRTQRLLRARPSASKRRSRSWTARPARPLLEASVVTALGNIAIELLDEPGGMRCSGAARASCGTANAMAYYRFWHDMNRSMGDETYGRPREALHAARKAAAAAPSDAFRIFAHCRRAAVLLAYDEPLGYEISPRRSARSSTRSTSTRCRRSRRSTSPAVIVATLALDRRCGRGGVRAAAPERAVAGATRAVLRPSRSSAAILKYVEALVADANGDTFSRAARVPRRVSRVSRYGRRAPRGRCGAEPRGSQRGRVGAARTSTHTSPGCRRVVAARSRGEGVGRRDDPLLASSRAPNAKCSSCSTTAGRRPTSPRPRTLEATIRNTVSRAAQGVRRR